jgi:DNA/RNA-binding domain of Phe-tRNA-synthetase-like protein
VTAGPDLIAGFVEPELAAEFPDLGVAYAVVDAVPGRSPEEVRRRLRLASDRFTGPKAVAMRQQAIPWAYRVFFRHIGIDPDEQRTPIEAIAVERMRAGAFASKGNVEDALLLATLETSVPVVAFDAAAVDGRVGLRLARQGEDLGEYRPLGSGQLVIADEQRPLAVLFADVSEEAAVGRATRRVVLAAIRVKGVPPVSVEEALWTAVETLTGDGP